MHYLAAKMHISNCGGRETNLRLVGVTKEEKSLLWKIGTPDTKNPTPGPSPKREGKS